MHGPIFWVIKAHFVILKNYIVITMYKAICLLLLLLTVSCSQSPAEKLERINGYWEIAQIENSYGFVKEYSISQNIDYFEITAAGKGVRKKVQPDLSGNFTTTNSSENIDVAIQDNTVFLNYSTAFDNWKEEVISVSTTHLVLRNEDNYTYTYRRYQPISID
jgi:hypothetical protein